MRLGIVIANQVPWANPDAILELAQAAEEVGVASVWVADHVVMPAAFSSEYPMQGLQSFDPKEHETFFEPLVTLAFVASRTSRVRLGTSIIVPTLRHPAYTAKLVATLDNLSGGRVVLGVGAGWLREEFDALGIEPFDRRGEMLDEHIAVLRALWSSEVATFEGAYYRLPPSRSAPKPASPNGPPVWIGGTSRAALRRVAKIGDGWQPMAVGPAELGTIVPELHNLVRRAGRDPNAIDICPRCDIAFGRPEQQKANGIYGDAEEVAAGLARYGAAGCTELILDLQPDDSLKGRLETLAQLRPLVRWNG
jgi:probable F420-dependent oxidoreductase